MRLFGSGHASRARPDSRVGGSGFATRLLSSLIGALLVMTVVAGPAVAAPTNTISRYMATASTQAHYDLGCERSRRKVGGPIGLIYGKPVLVGSSQGASLYGNPDATVAQIETAAKQFVQGYRDCAINAPQIILIIATTNDDSDPERVTSAHGAAWADLVDAVATWTSGQGYTALVNVQGGSDIEPGFNSVADSRAWVDGYESVNNRAMWNLGSADGCPQSGNGTVNGSCNNGWKQLDVLYVSWLLPSAVPLPQIYTNNSSVAKQWRYIKLYGVVSQSRTMTLQGSLTQWNACQEVGCASDIDNTPSQGWQQLFDQLNADARTAQSLSWSTDISWLK